jgi:hypothetical protein
MKTFLSMLAVLLALSSLLAALSLWPARSADCASTVVIVRDVHGRPAECVCMSGTLATCFDPGP